jgi:hypothetical protein
MSARRGVAAITVAVLVLVGGGVWARSTDDDWPASAARQRPRPLRRT